MTNVQIKLYENDQNICVYTQQDKVLIVGHLVFKESYCHILLTSLFMFHEESFNDFHHSNDLFTCSLFSFASFF